MNQNAQHFLKSIEQHGSSYNALKAGATLIDLVHSFWSYPEIEEALPMREEWDVPPDLIPFYGNWHELLCLSERTGQVVYLNDDREVVAAWIDTSVFLGSLTNVEEDPNVQKPTSSWLSDDLRAAAERFKRGEV